MGAERIPFAKSISPHTTNFSCTLDEDVKDIVLALRSKLYWTLSSHKEKDIKDKRSFSVAFRTRKEARSFIAQLKHHSKGVRTNLLTMSDYQDEFTEEQVAIRLNELFRINYRSFYVVEVFLCLRIYPSDSIIEKTKKLIDRKLFLKKRTEKVLDYIRTDLPYYWY